MASFFDLKEDGTLDVLLEYKDTDQSMAVDFIKCEDKGDTTFLKVQVFSSSCDHYCGSKKTKIGTKSMLILIFVWLFSQKKKKNVFICSRFFTEREWLNFECNAP